MPIASPRRLTAPRVVSMASLLFGLLLMVVPAPCPQADPGDVATYNGTTFNYIRNNLLDIDQRRAAGGSPFVLGLPGNGGMYCVPTAAMNLLGYIANHGYAAVRPYPNDWQQGPPNNPGVYNEMTLDLIQLGIDMQTDPVNGTGGATPEPALQDWLDFYAPGKFAVTHDWADETYSPVLKDAALLAIAGSLVEPVVGWYTNKDTNLAHVRKGGHAISLASAMGPGDQQQWGIRDPASPNDGQTMSQAAFKTDVYQVKDISGNFGYQDASNVNHVWQRTQSRIVDFGSAYMDGILAITPKFGLVAQPGRFRLVRLFVPPGDPVEFTFQPAAAKNILDLAINPVRTSHPYLLDGSNAIYLLDVLTGQSRPFATLPTAPRRLVYGGNKQLLYVLTAQTLNVFDRRATQLASKVLAKPLDAITFDGKRNVVAGASRAGGALFFFDPLLRAVTTTPVPAGSLGGTTAPLRLCHDLTDGSLVAHTDGSREAFRFKIAQATGLTTEKITFTGGVGELKGLFVDEKGFLFLSDAQGVRQFDRAGKLVEKPAFSKFPPGPCFEVLRPFNGFNPAVHVGPPYFNVLPENAVR